MTDPIQEPTQPQVTPSSSPAPLPNPQEMVNAVLGEDKSETPMPSPVTPTPITSTATEEIPLAFATAPTLPQAQTMTPSPTPEAPMPEPSPTPLPTPDVPAPENLSPVVEQPAVIPPADIPPAAPTTAPKKKGKGGVLIGGILALFVALIGGVLAYQYYSGANMIAIISGDKAVTTTKTGNGTLGGKSVGTTGTGTGNGGSLAGTGAGGKGTSTSGTSTTTSTSTKTNNTVTNKPGSAVGTFGYNYTTGQAASSSDWNDPNANIAGTYVSNGQRFVINIPSTQDAAVKYNIQTGGGLQGKIAVASTASTTDTIVWPNISLEEYNAEKALGKTWAPPGVGCNDMPSRTNLSNTNDGSEAQGGEAAVSCKVWHWTTCTNKGTGVDGVGCDVTTKTGGGGTTTITENTSPTMACTGITRTPTTVPAIGDKLTFTCAGTITPSTAGTLSYKFRYSINNGAATALTNKTATTAELSIAACGTYKVECQACATISGVLTCSPTWTGATQ